MKYVWDIANKETYNNLYGRYKYEFQYKFIQIHFTNRKAVLDIAGGSGRFAIPLHSLCTDITVLDINEEALSLLKTRNSEIKTICSDFMVAPLHKSFSFILCIEALSYFRDYDSFFKKVKTLLDKDGNFVFLMVNPDSWRFKLRKFNKHKADYGEITFSEIKVVIEKNGMVIDKIRGFNWIPVPISWYNSPLIKVFSMFEQLLNLGEWYAQSPWLMVSVKCIK